MAPGVKTVLVIDDEETNAKLICEALGKQEYDCRYAISAAQGLALLAERPSQLVLLDYDMPVMNGLETLNQIRGMKMDSDVMFVSAHANTNIIKTCLEKGADDFVRKPFSMVELVSRVAVRFRLRDLREKLAEANRKLQELNDQDDLTGLYNMRAMSRIMNHEFDRAKRTGRLVGCVMLDLDNFKQVNDTHDHLFGSFVLKEVAQILRQNIRSVDYAARYGGDEYVLMLVDATDEGVATACHRIREKIEEYLFTDGKSRHRQTASIGYAVGNPQEINEPPELIRAADYSLYDAKKAGRNTVSGRTTIQTKEFLAQPPKT